MSMPLRLDRRLTSGSPGQRLAAQKGQSDDLVGAMKANERAGQEGDDASDEEAD